MRFVQGSLAAALLLTSPRQALAQSNQPRGDGYIEHAGQSGQNITFDDDALAVLPQGFIGIQLGNFHPPRRFILMRPRTTFVPALLKSIESM